MAKHPLSRYETYKIMELGAEAFCEGKTIDDYTNSIDDIMGIDHTDLSPAEREAIRDAFYEGKRVERDRK